MDIVNSSASAVARLTDRILGSNSDDLVDILKAVASEIGLSHISHVRLASNRASDVSTLTAIATYPKLWQIRYFLKKYSSIDPVIKRGRDAVLPFDWSVLYKDDDPEAKSFLADAVRHGVGCSGISIPVRNRRNAHALVSFTSNIPGSEWEWYKKSNMTFLQQLSALIDSAASIDAKLPSGSIQLSPREEQCLVWAARGKTYQEIADILSLSLGSVKTHLDTARHKLHCINLTHAVGMAMATGLIPTTALRDRSSFRD